MLVVDDRSVLRLKFWFYSKIMDGGMGRAPFTTASRPLRSILYSPHREREIFKLRIARMNHQRSFFVFKSRFGPESNGDKAARRARLRLWLVVEVYAQDSMRASSVSSVL